MGSIRRSKTKRRTRDFDLVHADLRSAKHLAQHKEIKPAEDLPGLGQFYCIECAKWFESEHNMVEHRRGKNHKRRCRLLKEEPYTQREAEAAVGITTDNGVGARPVAEAMVAEAETVQDMDLKTE